MRGTILYYVVGPVHPRNMQLVAEMLPEWTFHMIYESDIWWFNNSSLANIAQKKIPFSASSIHRQLDPSEYSAVVFSTVQPRSAPIALLKWALEYELPTLAVEEANQFGMVSEVENHYLLPVDHLLAASHYGKQNFVDIGVCESRIRVTGWPFYTGDDQISIEQRRKKKVQMGLDPDRPVAALTLAALNTYGETPNIRQKQLEIAAKGLPEEYQFVIKPHPIEKKDELEPFASRYASDAVLIDGRVPIGEVLEIADILLNRGVSQVTIEALIHKIPVIVLSMENKTIFHSLVPEVIAHRPEDLMRVLTRIGECENTLDLYRNFLAEHIPYSPIEARQLTCQTIAEVAADKSIETKRSELWLDLALYEGWQVDKKAAIKILSNKDFAGLREEANALLNLLSLQASRGDLALLKAWFGNGYREQVLQCLWIDVLIRRRQTLSEEDLTWMNRFPSEVNIHLFMTHCFLWMKILLRAEKRREFEVFSNRLIVAYDGNHMLADINRDIQLYYGGVSGRSLYELRRLRKLIYRCLGAIKRMVHSQ